MGNDTETNAAERRRWNDEYWASVWLKREQLTTAITGVLLDRVGLSEGENVLDIGSGGGTATIAASHLVGARGSVVGADISAPLVELARQRALDQRVANVSFVVADVQQDTIAGAPFDAAMSQFGVMFFDEPETAFANIRRHLVAGGRLGFACWESVEKNPWFIGPALAGYVPSAPAPAPGKSPTGPFSLSDPARVIDILASGGWTGVKIDPHDVAVDVERDAIIDDAQLTFLGVPEGSFQDARRAVEQHLKPLTASDGRIHANLSFQIVAATA